MEQLPRRAHLGQHFLCNRRLVDRLVRACALTPQDTVLEIGPGRGILTEALLRTGARVLAVEIDPRLCRALRQRWDGHPRLTLIEGDALTQPLPTTPYKVVASLPYAHTSALLRKLLNADRPPSAGGLIIQREAAEKWCVRERGNHLAALLHYPWWELRIGHHLRRADFSPPPKVDSVWLNLTLRLTPHLEARWRALYQDYAAYRFERDPRAKAASPEQFLNAFRAQAQHAQPAQRRIFRGAFQRWQTQQQRLSKIHRTRTDPQWKRFRR